MTATRMTCAFLLSFSSLLGNPEERAVLPSSFWRPTAPRAVILELARESRGTSGIAFILLDSRLRRLAPSFSSLLGNPEERAVLLSSFWIPAYGASRRHSRACSGIQRNEQYCLHPSGFPPSLILTAKSVYHSRVKEKRINGCMPRVRSCWGCRSAPRLASKVPPARGR